MSYASSAVTYTSIYTDSEPGRVFWGADEEPSDRGPPRVIIYGYDGLPMQPVAPPSPDYVPRPEHPPSLDYVPGPEHPPLPVEPLPTDASPTALSPGYVADSDPDEDPEEDPEEDHADYPADGGDGDDEPSDDDDDDTDDEEEEPYEDEDDDEEEEHLALADSSAIPVVNPVPSARDTEAFETDESAPIPKSPQIRVPFAQSSPPLPLPSPLTTSPIDVRAPLGYRAAGIRLRAASPPLLLPSTSYRTDIPEAEMPPWKRACFTTPTHRLEVGESSAAGAARQPRPTLEADLRRDRETEEFQVRFEDAQDDRAFLRARVNTLFRDRRFHLHTAMLLDREAMYAHQKAERPRALDGQLRLAAAVSHKMAPRKRTTRASPATTTTPTSTPVTDAQLRALIERGVAAVLAERDADKSRNGDDSHDSGT
ncbi:hypothetical protein Tco_0823449 [Tanacetum coccineum]|uniref:Uncharacterized protein n=1 Tax=Tanacetum coccineum TaxID=301880 RepID=A0ABQ5AI24_9ASTR